MCTRANRASVSDSAHALVGSIVALLAAFATLGVAVTTVPVRLVRARATRYGQPASIAHVQVQVHLNNVGRVHEIERSCRSALGRAARTWAPFPLPLDRVEVVPSAPPLGKADIFQEWIAADGDSGPRSLVVVSIGTAAEGHDLTADDIGGALAGQIERLVVERYQREHPKADTPARVSEAATARAILQPLTAVAAPLDEVDVPGDNVTDLSTVRALLADIKKSQPLVPAGSFTNGVHLETDPAS